MDKNLINTKITIATKHLEALEAVSFTHEDLENDIDTYSKLYYLYQNVIERCLGLAVLLIKEKNLSIPDTARDAFNVLAKNKTINQQTANRLSGAYGFRNAIIHDYDNLNTEELTLEHDQNVSNLKQYLKEISEYVNST